MSATEHRHDFRPAVVRDAHGQVLPGAQRCACGVEVTAGRLGINVEVVRIGQRFNDALADGLAELARILREGRHQ